MLVREIMTAPAFHVRKDAEVDDALEILAVRRVTALPVVDDEGALVGMLSEIDILRGAVAPDSRAHARPVQDDETVYPSTVSEIMTTDVVSVSEGDDVAELVERFASRKIKSAPVVRGDKLIGVISRSDIIRALYRPDDELEDELVVALHDSGLTDWSATVERGTVTLTGPGDEREAAGALALIRAIIGVRKVVVAENSRA
ncbi:MAG: CBS domain-containing protein [Dermatophilus congolensis]|nr:CBS domain-containing protein [Dermatophilus congolensis]